MNWQYANPVNIIFTHAFDEFLANLIYDKKNIAVICSKRFQDSYAFGKLKKSLADFSCFTDIENNPTFDSCQKAINFARDTDPDVIIAIGGGSVIDTTKAARMALYRSCYDIKKLFNQKNKPGKKPLFIAIPTTHGSGSELTMWATIWDKYSMTKSSMSDSHNYADYAIYDTSLVSSLPVVISISATLDALSHAWEALWNKNANPISNAFAAEAIRLIAQSIDKLVEPISPETREYLLMASMYAGLAFSNTRTAAAHSISYPLSTHFNIPHGIACSMPLHSLAEINFQYIKNELPHVFSRCNLSGFEQLWGQVQKTVKGRVPFTLREYGVTREDLEMLMNLSFSKDRMGNNIADLSEHDVLKILMDIY